MMSFVQKDVQTFPPNQFGIKWFDEVFFCTQFHRLSELGEMKRVRHDDDANARESLAHFLEHSHSTEHRHLELDQHAASHSSATRARPETPLLSAATSKPSALSRSQSAPRTPSSSSITKIRRCRDVLSIIVAASSIETDRLPMEARFIRVLF